MCILVGFILILRLLVWVLYYYYGYYYGFILLLWLLLWVLYYYYGYYCGFYTTTMITIVGFILLLWLLLWVLLILYWLLLLGFECCSDESISFHYIKVSTLYYFMHCTTTTTTTIYTVYCNYYCAYMNIFLFLFTEPLPLYRKS